MKKSDLLAILDDLIKMDDVLACMVVKKGLEGIMPTTLKIKNAQLWEIIKKTTDQLFYFIDNFYDYKLERVYFELGQYTIIIVPINRDFSLITLTPSMSNMGLLDVEIENTVTLIKNLGKSGS